MGIDWDSLWGNVQAEASKAWDKVETVGVPAVQSSLEKWGIDVLTKQNKETEAKLNEGMQQLASEPTQPGTFGYYLKDALEAPLLKQHGGMIVAGVAGLIVVGMLLRK